MDEGVFYKKVLEAQKEGRWQDAVKCLREGVSHNDSMCMWLICHCALHEYWNIKLTVSEMTSLCRKGKALGNVRCMMLLYKMYKKWDNDAEESIFSAPEGVNSYEKGYCLAHEFFNKQCDYEHVKSLLLTEKHCFSYQALGFLEGAHDDMVAMTRWYRMGAEDGYAVSQVSFAYTCCDDYTKKLYWLKKAAQQEYVAAFVVLYHGYLDSSFGKINMRASLYWINKILQKESHIHTFEFEQAKKTREKYQKIFDGIELCQRSCMTLIAIRKYTQSTILSLPKDVVVLLGKVLWETAEDEAWQDK